MSGKLILTGTPIGNLGDMSPRAINTLENCDFIAAEDTRVTLKLLNHFGIKKPMVSYYEHNKRERGQAICQRILSGETCVLVTDAGMPAISDPGEELVKQCSDNNIEVLVVPGPSAVISALALSGLPTGRFTFEGFLSVNKKNRQEHLSELFNETRTMVFYEGSAQIANTLEDLFEYLGERKIAIVREITKIHEQVIRLNLSEAIEKNKAEPLKGEIVIVVEGKSIAENTDKYTLEEAVKIAADFISNGESASTAAKNAAKITKIKKGDIYKALLTV